MLLDRPSGESNKFLKIESKVASHAFLDTST